jgi:predicted ester cyclase
LDAIDEIYHKDFIRHDPDGSVSTGVEKHKRMVARIRKTIPDHHENLQSMIVEGDLVACRWTSSGTDRKSGKKWSHPCLSTYRFKDGKIIEQWLFFGRTTQ